MSAAPPAPNRPKASSFRQRIVLLIISIALALTAAEVLLRVGAPLALQRQRYMLTRHVLQYEDHAIRFDPELGFRGTPNHRQTFANAEFTTTIALNSAGFRDDETSLADPVILLAGDSIGMGWGVEKEETAEAHLERLVGQPVLNMSMSGYGTNQESLILQRWINAHPFDRHMRLAIILFYSNDIRENAAPHYGVYPNLYNRDTRLNFSRATESNFNLWLASCRGGMLHGLPRLSWIAWLADDAIGSLRRQWFGWEDPRHRVVSMPLPPGVTRVPGDHAFAISLEEAALAARRRGIRILVAYVPHFSQFDGVDFSQTRTAIEQMTRQSRCEFLDLSDAMSKADYFVLDEHLRPSGQRKIGEALKRVIDERGLLQAPAASQPSSRRE